MLKLGNQSISAAYLGGMEIKKAYLGEEVVFDVSEPPVPTYTITASIDPAGSGTVSGAGTYPAGETVTITATPGDGYKFTGWQENGAVVSEDAAYSFMVTGERTLTAVFEAVPVNVIPEEYTELEYIACPTSANTNSYPPYISIPETKEAISVQIEFTSTIKLTGNYGNYIIGVSNGSAVTSLVRALGIYSNNIFMRQGTYNLDSAQKQITVCELDKRYNAKIYPSTKTVEINGTSYAYNANSNSNWASMALNLFRIPTLGDTLQLSPRGVRLHRVQWYDADLKILRDLVPVRDLSGVLGVYDVIGKEFFKNSNTSTSKYNIFEAGPAV